MGAWSHEIFGSDDAGDMSDAIGDFIGLSNWTDDGEFAEYVVCSPDRWNSEFATSVRDGLEKHSASFVEFVAAGYKIRRKAFKDLTEMCRYDTEDTFGLVLPALYMNSGAVMPKEVLADGIRAIEANLTDEERLEDWNDGGTGRKRMLRSFRTKLKSYSKSLHRRVKIT